MLEENNSPPTAGQRFQARSWSTEQADQALQVTDRSSDARTVCIDLVARPIHLTLRSDDSRAECKELREQLQAIQREKDSRASDLGSAKSKLESHSHHNQQLQDEVRGRWQRGQELQSRCKGSLLYMASCWIIVCLIGLFYFR